MCIYIYIYIYIYTHTCQLSSPRTGKGNIFSEQKYIRNKIEWFRCGFSFNPTDTHAPYNHCCHAHSRQGCVFMPMCMHVVMSWPGTPQLKETNDMCCHAFGPDEHGSGERRGKQPMKVLHLLRSGDADSTEKHRHDASRFFSPWALEDTALLLFVAAVLLSRCIAHPWMRCWHKRGQTPQCPQHAMMYGHAMTYTHGRPCLSTSRLMCWGSSKKGKHLARRLLALSIGPMAGLALLRKPRAMGRGGGPTYDQRPWPPWQWPRRAQRSTGSPGSW